MQTHPEHSMAQPAAAPQPAQQAAAAPRRRRAQRTAEKNEDARAPGGAPQPAGVPQPANAPQPSGVPQPAPARRASAPPYPPYRAAQEIARPARAKPPLLTRPMWALLVALVLALCTALGCLWVSQDQLDTLRAQRQAEADAYAALVARHTVEYRAWIEQYAAENDIHPAFVAAVILRESSYDPRAVSSADARGLMQLMPDTAQWVADKLDVDGYSLDMMFDPETNIRFGCWYLGYLSREFGGDPVKIACAYHAGQGNVRSWLTKYSPDGSSLPIANIPMDDTKSYAQKVVNAYAIYYQHYYPDAA